MNAYNQLSDAELAMLLNERDQKAFAEIYDRYWGLLFNHARRMLKDEDSAGDMVQDVFASLLNRMGSLEFTGTLSAYLYASTRNTILNLIAKQKVRGNYMDSLKNFVEAGAVEADANLREKELQRQIEREIEALPGKMRMIFELSRHAHLSYKEIAQQTGVSEGTVRKQIYYALKILRGKLGAGIYLSSMYAIILINRWMN